MKKIIIILMGIVVVSGATFGVVSLTKKIQNLGAVTPISVPAGGTGRTTFPTGECLKGNLTGGILTGVCGSTYTASNPLTISGTNISIDYASASGGGYLTSGDWTTFNSKQDTITASNPLTLSGGTLTIDVASASGTGALSGANWTTFNNKQDTIIDGSNLTFASTTLNVDDPFTVVNLNGTHVSASDDLSITNAISGAGLTSCSNGTTSKLLYTSATRQFSCGTDTDTNTTYTAGGTLLNLTGTVFNVREGTLTNGKLCTYNSTGTQIECNTTDQNTTYTSSAPLYLEGTNFRMELASASGSGYLSNTDWSTFNGKQAAGNYITALTGEVTATGPGSVAATIANMSSATLAGKITDETGSGALVFGTSPTFTTSALFPGSGIWNSSGNVGIGTTGPTGSLHIVRTTSGNNIIITPGSTNAQNLMQFNKNAGTGAGFIGLNTGETAFEFSGNNLDTFISTNTDGSNNPAGAYVYLKSTGNVGIGTAGPGAKLEIVTSNNPNGLRISQGAVGYYADSYYEGTTWHMGSAETTDNINFAITGGGTFTTGGGFIFTPGTSGTVRIDKSGNVGIGTTAPGNKLSVVNDIGILTSSPTSAGYGYLNFYTQANRTVGSQIIGIAGDTGGELAFYTGAGSNVLGLYQNKLGNVGIGTAGPGSLLDVAGTIRQSTVKSCTLGLTTDANGGITGCVASDENLKKNIVNSNYSALTIISELQPVNYKWKDVGVRDTLTHTGFIAQNVQKVFPSGVSQAGTDIDGNPIWGVDANSINALLVAGMKEQQQEILNLSKPLGSIGDDGLVKRVDSLESRVAELEKNSVKKTTMYAWLLVVFLAGVSITFLKTLKKK